MIEDKIMCIGIGLQEYYCVCAIIGLLKKTQSPEHPSNEEQKAAYGVAQVIQKLLSLQDNYSAAATLASLPTKMVGTQSREKTVQTSNEQLPVPIASTSVLPSNNGHSNGSNNNIDNGTGNNINEIGSTELMDETDMLEVK